MDNAGNAELNYCYNCMMRMDSGQTVCPACGHDNTLRLNPENALPEGTILAGRYLVGKVLGQGGFGITYLGFDIVLNIKVAIKEYFPVGVSVRLSHSIRVTAVSSQEKAEGFRKGCDEFQAEAQRLAAIESPNIVKVRDYFRENGTAYIVMNYLEGCTLTKEVSACGGKMPWRRVMDLFNPMILELDKLHKAHLMHRDIKPDNLKIIKDDEGAERLVLLDFGAARSFVSSEVTGTYSAMVTHGYAPMEQYSPKSRQGPFTDIYALCAAMYAVITGVLPAAAMDRVTDGAEIKTFSEMGIDIPENVEKAIFHGLEVRGANRPQSMRELYEEMNGKDRLAGGGTAAERSVPVPRKEEKQKEGRKSAGEPKPKKKTRVLLPVLLAVLLAAGFFLYRGIRQNRLNLMAAQLTADGQTTQTAQAEMTEQAAAAVGTRTAMETQEAAEALAAQAEQESLMERTAQAETRQALNTAAAKQTEAALEQIRIELEQTEAAFRVMETEAAYEETRRAMEMRMTSIAAAKTKAAEPTSTPMPTMTAAATATLIPTMTNTPKPTATKTPRPTVTNTPEPTIAPTKSQIRVGDTIKLGKYEQDGNTANGAEAIEWQVLAVGNRRALVISKYGLDAKPYNEEWTGVTWETSTLRAWLNGEFYNGAFSSEEKGRIQKVRLRNPDNAEYGTKGGNDTTDRIFLLSIEEAKQYFADNEARQCRSTAYAKNHGAGVSETNAGMTWWWLRSPGLGDTYGARVNSAGNVLGMGYFVRTNSGVVRPAFWMDLGSEPVSVMPATPIPTNTPLQSVTPEPTAIPTKPTIRVGDIITLGHYEQDGNSANGEEAIEWQVLAVENRRALVISKYGLDAKPYNEEWTGVTWETSTLRAWLNGEFYNGAFSSEEKGRIQKVRLRNPDNAEYGTKGGNDTTDRIFLLSIEEAKQYFADNEARQCRSTTYAKNHGAGVSETNAGMTWWWLRSPGLGDTYGARVNSAGNVLGMGYFVRTNSGVVRPAFWMDLSSEPVSVMPATPIPTNTPLQSATPEPTAIPTKPTIRVGDIITLGHYEQDGNSANGEEAIEWQVLAVENRRALVISRYGLEAKPYNEEWTGVTWETSTLRAWLNGEFYNGAFSSEEKGRIQKVRLRNPDNAEYGTKGGNDTTDRIFLLSIEEAKQYFADNEARQCRSTTYAENHGAGVSETNAGMTWWWLRSPGLGDTYGARVNSAGNVLGMGYFVRTNSGVVRPAFWMDL